MSNSNITQALYNAIDLCVEGVLRKFDDESDVTAEPSAEILCTFIEKFNDWDFLNESGLDVVLGHLAPYQLEYIIANAPTALAKANATPTGSITASC